MSDSEHAAHEDHTQHYVRIWAILVILLVISVLGPMLEIRLVTLLTAFGIAVVKAYLVAKNFMHINVEQRFVPYAMVTCLVFMLLLFAGTAPDVMKAEGTGWQKPEWLEDLAQSAAPPQYETEYTEEHGGDAGHH
jgi:caa(3)-type oxidase subunit IV